jgi:O-acetyl-ADP-ribose deacetylase (regulator of RNase III)
MLKIIHNGNIFSSTAQTLVNPVNCVGVMGAGLALEFRNRYPEMFLRYREICGKHLLSIGKLWIWKGPDRWILCFPTKINWRNNSSPEIIEAGLKKFVAKYREIGISSIAFPMLGCGLGGLDQSEIHKIYQKHLEAITLPCEIFSH